jgi:hypothetical protein
VNRVMTFTPYGDRLEPETVRAIFRMEYDGPLTNVFQHTPQTGDPHRDILRQYQIGRELFLNSDADYLMVIESDIIPPKDTITKLMDLGADVAYGVYVFRTSEVINVYERYEGTPRNTGSSLSLSKRKLQRAVKARRTKCSGGGLGCALIKRHALIDIDFRIEDTAHCDTYFNRDALRAGLNQMADMSVICGHKREDSVILWPEFANESNS